MKKQKIISWNVNGIRAIAKKGFHDWFKSANPDILCLQETKAWPEQLAETLTDIDGYTSYFSEASKKGYSGTVIYTKEKPISVKHGIGIEEFDSEGRFVIAEYSNFVLFNIYFPNGKAREERLKYKMDFYKAFQKYVVDLAKKGKNIIVCGDVNTAHKEIDLARPKANSKISGFLPTEREWMDDFFADGFIDTLRMFNDKPEIYTWWSMISKARPRNVGWRIDYFFINESLRKNITDAYTLPDVMGSDHCPVGIDINF